ncbi:MarR family transcriptional regulator [[Clostridium] innocuum]|nr:MarR family transcriptional regulator [[Clostridium] innocuum]
MKREDINAFMDEFYSISCKMNQIRITPITFQGNITTNSAGLFFMDAIASHKGIKMSEIGEVLGITKGAVSQMAAKLEKKHLIRKIKSKTNAKDIYLELTPQGEQVNLEQCVLRKKMYEGISEIISDYSEHDTEIIRVFLNQAGLYLEQYRKELARLHEE